MPYWVLGIWMGLSGAHIGCSKQTKVGTLNSGLSASTCVEGSREHAIRSAQETLTWCRRGDGVDEGPVMARYADGRPKAEFRLKNGQLHGAYRAWHPNGRRAIRQAFHQGRLVGRRTFWPTIGPSTECGADECTGSEAVLGRTFCVPEHISTTLSENQAALDACSRVVRRPVHVEFSWWIDLLGRPYALEKTAGDESDVSKCIGRVLHQMRYPIPFGDTCRVTIPFKFMGANE